MMEVSGNFQADPDRQNYRLHDDERPTTHHRRQPIRDSLTGSQFLGISLVDVDDGLMAMDVADALPFPFFDDGGVGVGHWFLQQFSIARIGLMVASISCVITQWDDAF